MAASFDFHICRTTRCFVLYYSLIVHTIHTVLQSLVKGKLIVHTIHTVLQSLVEGKLSLVSDSLKAEIEGAERGLQVSGRGRGGGTGRGTAG